jgi:hypothetical protein
MLDLVDQAAQGADRDPRLLAQPPQRLRALRVRADVREECQGVVLRPAQLLTPRS